MPGRKVTREPRSRSASRSRSTKSRSRSTSRSRVTKKRPASEKKQASPSPKQVKEKSPIKKSEKKVEKKDKTEKSPSRKSPSRKVSPPKASPTKGSFTSTTGVRHSRRIQEIVETEKSSSTKQVAETSKLINTPDRPLEYRGKSKPKCSCLDTLLIGSLLLVLPVIVYYLNKLCLPPGTLRLIKPSIDWRTYVDWKVMLVYVAFVKIQGLLMYLPIGRVVKGSKSKSHRCNGLISLVLTVVAFVGLVQYKWIDVNWIHSNYTKLIVSALISSTMVSIFFYCMSRWERPSQLNSAGNTGNIINDFFTGRSLNPRHLGIDIKLFYEFRPGLIGWFILELAMCIRDLNQNNWVLANMNHSLLLISACHFIYIIDSLYYEAEAATKLDIINQGFGFMFCFGNSVWVPFIFSLTARTVLLNKLGLKPICLPCIAFMKLIGYLIYRGSNSQKNMFRDNPYQPSLSHLETITDSHGKQLIVSGWWGLVRHPNYLGEIIMTLAWSLPAGFTHVLPWLYPAYFITFIIWREYSDEALCARKHGVAWEKYKKKVPCRIIPKIF